MNKPRINPFFIQLLKEYNESYVYYDFNRPKGNRQRGYYLSKHTGLREFNPVIIFEGNHMKRFHKLKDLFMFLENINYNKWRHAKYNKHFIDNHFDMVKKLYYPRNEFNNIIEIINNTRNDLKEKYNKIITDFKREDIEALKDFDKFVKRWGSPLN